MRGNGRFQLTGGSGIFMGTECVCRTAKRGSPTVFHTGMLLYLFNLVAFVFIGVLIIPVIPVRTACEQSRMILVTSNGIRLHWPAANARSKQAAGSY